MDTKLNFLVAFVTMFALMHNCSALLTACTVNGNCTAVTANSECNTTLNNGTGECVCTSAYKEDDSGGCTEKGLADACTGDGDCANVTNASCNSSSTCACEGQYKESGGSCVDKVLADPCTVDGDCAGVSNAACNSDSDTCVCEGRYKGSGGSCVDKVLDDGCSVEGDCAGISNAQCLNSSCKCDNGHKSTNTITCSTVLEETCTADTNCTAYVDYSECSGDPLKCNCITGYSKDGALCVQNSAQSISGYVILIAAPFTTILCLQKYF